MSTDVLGLLCRRRTDEDNACENPTPYRLGSIAQGVTVGESIHSGSCGGRGSDAAFVFQPDADGIACVSTAGSRYDTVLYVRQDNCADGDEVACNDDSQIAGGVQSAVEFQYVEGEQYFIFVDGFNGAGPFQLTSSNGNCRENPPPLCVEDAQCPDGLVCANGACELAEAAPNCEAPRMARFGRFEGTTMAPRMMSEANAVGWFGNRSSVHRTRARWRCLH